MSTLLAQIFFRQFTKTLIILYLIIGLSTSPIIISSSWAEESIPSWIKNNAGWWASGMITEDEFLKGIEYLINNNIILIDSTIDEKAYIPTDTSSTKRVPDWVKNNADWWAGDLIGDSDFLNGIKYLINKGIILVSVSDNQKEPTTMTAPNSAMLFEGVMISNYWKFLKDLNLPSPILQPISSILKIPNDESVQSIFDVYGVRNDSTTVDGNVIWGTPVFGLNVGQLENYNTIAIWDDPQKAAVVSPIFTDSAYDRFGFYDYYRGDCDSCTTTTISDGVLDYNSSVYGYQLLTLLGYSPITDIDIDKNPSILKKYDKIIMLHNEYVTRAMFDAITSHPKVIYLYPNALYAEIEVDYDNNTITLIRGHNYPEEEITNGFDWEFDNTHPYEYDNNCEQMLFYPIDNGWMSNCYPEKILPASPIIFQTLKDL